MALTECEVTLLNIGKIFGPSMLSALVAFWLFRMTSKRDRDKDEAKSEKERLNRIKYLIHIANETLKMVDAQVEDFEEHINILEEERFTAVPLSYHNKRSCELLVELTSSEATFVMFTKTKFKQPFDKVAVYSKISSESVFIDSLVDDIIKGAREYIDYTAVQTRKIQSYIDGILKEGNVLSLGLQRLENRSEIENYFIKSFKEVGEEPTAKDDRSLKAFYYYFTLPLGDIIDQCKREDFSDIDQLLLVARERDKAHRSYNELLSSWKIYLDTFKDRTSNLKEESAKFRELLSSIKEPI